MLKPSNNLLIIFVKYPQAGRVKTRLAKDVGKRKAADLYRLFTEAVLKRTEGENFKRIICYTPQDKEKEIKKWLGSDGLEFCPQKGRGLGERLCNAFGFALGSSGSRRIVAIGSDSPLIDKEVVHAAFKALETKQCVLGPAVDGGYYLIGLSSLSPVRKDRATGKGKEVSNGLKREVFKGIGWSTRKVFTQTVARLKRLKISYRLLDTSFDVDRYKDIACLRQKIGSSLQINPSGLKPIAHALRRIAR